MTADELASRLERVKKSGSGYVARCPAHQDKEPSLSVSTGDDGRVLLHCHVGCTPDAIVRALGLSLSDLFPPTETHQQREITQRYPYRDEHGTLLYEVVRLEAPGQGKTFRQRRPTADGGWDWKLGDTRRVLYHLPELRAAIDQGATVYVAEGEKDVHALEQAGAAATCNPGGAGKWRPEYTTSLLGAERVVVIADRDDTGHAHARVVHDALTDAGVPVEIRQARTGKDAHDHLAAGHTLDQLEPLPEPPAPAPDHSWVPEPLDTDDDDEQEPERILGLFYPRLRHLVYGEPESLKTWLALCAVAEVAKKGGRALWIDHEMSARVIRSRLRNLGCTREQRSLVTYIRPTSALDERSRPHLQQILDQEQPEIVVVDAYTGALGLAMLDDNSNIDVERWNQGVGALLWGPEKRCLIVLDHVNKDKETRGRWSSGSKRKLEGADVAYSMEMVKRLGRQPGQDGKATIKAQKDRPAWLPSMRPGDLELRVGDDGTVAYSIVPVATTDGDTKGELRPTKLMEKVSRRLEDHGQPVTKNWVDGLKLGKAQWVRKAVDLLVKEGYVDASEGARNAIILTLQKPYREAWDTTSSHLVPPRPDLVPDEVHATSSHLVPPPEGGNEVTGRGQQGHGTSSTSSHERGSEAWLAQAPLEEIRVWMNQQEPA